MSKRTQPQQKQLGDRIRKLRLDHGFSQEQLAKLLHIPRQAIGQIEKGERAIDAQELLELSKHFSVTADSIIKPPSNNKTRKLELTNDVINFEFNKNKFRQLLLYILTVCGGKPNLGETVLYKLLYFIDFNAFESWGKPITGLTYKKMQFGPVPLQSNFLTAVQEMVERKELKIFNHEYYDKPQKRYVALSEPDLESFSMKEKQLIDRVIRQLSDMTAAQISEYAHHDAPWILAEENEAIRYTDVIERITPYAQVDHWGDWLDTGAKDVLKYIPPLTDEEIEHYKNL